MSTKTVPAGQTTVTFTITPGTTGNRTITLVSTSPALSVAGTPITYDGLGTAVTVPAGQTTVTFTITAGTTGVRAIALAATSPALTIDGSPINYTGTSPATTVATVSLENTYGPAATNQYLIMPLASANFPFSQVQTNGRNIEILASDGVTPIACSLRTWGSTVGLRWDLANSILGPASGSGHSYATAVGPSTGNLGLSNDPQTVVGTGQIVGGSDSDLMTAYGQWDCYDRLNNHVWTFTSPSHDYPMSMCIGDVSGSGDYVVAVGTRRNDHSGILLNANGTTRWTWTSTYTNSLGHGPYLRTSAIGKITNSYAGNQVVFGGSEGQCVCLTSTGSVAWGPLTLSISGWNNTTIQAGLITNLTGAGLSYFYCVQGNQVYEIDGTGATIWTYTSPLASTSFQFNYYGIAAGYITSLASKQLVVVSSSGSGANTSACGLITVINSSGALVWNKIVPYPLYAVTCGDVNGDGYAEIFAFWGNLTSSGNGFNHTSSGGLLVLDLNGNEITSGSMTGASKGAFFAPYDGKGTPGIEFVTDDRWLYRCRCDSTSGGSLEVTVPSVPADASENIYIAASTNASYLPALGGYDFTAFSGMTQELGTWTYASGTITSPSSGDTSANDAIEMTGYTTDGLELEFTFVKNDQGTGVSTDYYGGAFYRANTWSSGLPNGFRIIVGAKGHVYLHQYASGNATPVQTLVAITSSGLTFNTTDAIKIRVVCTGIDHSAAYSKNGGPWTVLFWVLDPAVTPLTTAGTVALMNSRGQTQYSNLVLRGIPNAYSGTGPLGPVAIPYLSQLASPSISTAVLSGF